MPTFRQAIVVTAAFASLAASACSRDDGQQDSTANTANAARQQTVPELPIPAPQPPLNREQLLLAAIRAASDFAAGVDDTQRQKELAGKKFQFQIRFGCAGPGTPGTPFGWTLNEKTGALKVRAAPTLSLDDSPVRAIAGEAFETVEGLWVERPWLLGATCPRSGAAAAAKPAGEETAAATPKPIEDVGHSVGIAQFFTATGSRTMRRSGRPYEATKRLETGDEPAGGFDIILSGQLAPLPNGQVIACTEGQDRERPACIISVEFGRIWIERADTHEQIAQWGTG